MASPPRNQVAGEIARYLGAVSVLAVGAVHAQQYYGAYFSAVPTIGTLFLLSFVGSGAVGVMLLAPVRRLGRRISDAILVLAAMGGIAIAAGSLAGLFVSESVGLFGFKEYGYREAIVISIVLESATILLLAAFLAASSGLTVRGTGPLTGGAGTGSARRRPGTRPDRAGGSA